MKQKKWRSSHTNGEARNTSSSSEVDGDTAESYGERFSNEIDNHHSVSHQQSRKHF